MLKIALLGAPHTGKSALASGLNSAVKASAWPAIIRIEADILALPVALPSYDLVLLTGLETAINTHREALLPAAGQQAQIVADASIRTALADARISYRVLYGRSEERLAQACDALQSLLPQAQPGRIRAPTKPWFWSCDKCSDPQCEHRLLTALLTQRSSRV